MKPELFAVGIAVTCTITMLIGVLIGKLIYDSKLEEANKEHKKRLKELQDKCTEKYNTYETAISKFQRKNVELKDKITLLEIRLDERDKKIIELEKDRDKELTAEFIKTVIDTIKK
ncbi:TPA: hypothetical protein N2D99_002287 [Clostridium botulinum]|nr:hypothetical protein [Clostridium botulinum]